VSNHPYDFPPSPRGLRGRASELDALERSVTRALPARIALVGSGGSGKSMLAAALGYRLARKFRGRIHWFRIGAWDFRTLAEMLALRFRTTRERHRIIPALRAVMNAHRLIVLDNHEDDSATARLLEAFSGTRATFLITARRCLLSGVLVYPVTAPLVTSGKSAFPRVARLTRMLRWNPLALAIADAIVASASATASSLERFLEEHGIGRVRVIDHEDDLPEVALLVAWAWSRLSAESRRILGVLAHVEGDHVDAESLLKLAKAKRQSIGSLARWQLVQEAMPGRFTVHAVVRHAVKKRTKASPHTVFEHYVRLLERHPDRLELEQTHLFAAMDYAHRTSSLDDMLRVERLLAKIG
jgi:hypothetical protein